MLRTDTSQRSVSPDCRSRSGGAGAKSIYGAVKSGAPLSSAPGAIRHRSMSRAIPLSMPAGDVRCLVSRADSTASAGLIDAGDSRRGMLLITGGRNGQVHIRSAVTGAVESLRPAAGTALQHELTADADCGGLIGTRTGTTVTALCLGPANKLWCGYNDGVLRVYGLDSRAQLLGVDTIASGTPLGSGGSGGGGGVASRRTLSPGTPGSVVSSGRNSGQGIAARSVSFAASSARSGGEVRGAPAVTALQNRTYDQPAVSEELGLLAESRRHSGAITAIVRTDVCVFTASVDWQICRWCVNAPYAMEGCVGSHTLAVRSLLITPRFLVSGGDDSDIRLWPFQLLDKNTTLAGHSTAVTALCFHQGLLWSGSQDGAVRLWTIEGAKRCVHVLTPHSTAVTTITPLDTTLYTCDKAGNVAVWDTSNASGFAHSGRNTERGGGDALGSTPAVSFGRIDDGVADGGGRSTPPSIELLHVFRVPLPKLLKSPAAAAAAASSACGVLPGAQSAQSGSRSGAATPRSATTAATASAAARGRRSPERVSKHGSAASYIHDVRLVANVKGILAWIVTTDGCKLTFLPRRPVEEELERKHGPMGDLDADDAFDAAFEGPAGSGVFTKQEIVAMQQQLEAFEEREAEQVEQLQEYREQLEDFAAFTNVVMEDVLVQSLEMYDEHRVRIEKFMKAARAACSERAGKDLERALARIGELEQALAEKETKLAEKSKLLVSANSKLAAHSSSKTDEISKLSADLTKSQQELRQMQFDLRHSKDALAISEAACRRHEARAEKLQSEVSQVPALKLELKRVREQLEAFEVTADRHMASAKKHSTAAPSRATELLTRELREAEAARDEARVALETTTARLDKTAIELLSAQRAAELLKDEVALLNKNAAQRATPSRARSQGAGGTDALGFSPPKQASSQRALGKALGDKLFSEIVAWREEHGFPPLDVSSLASGPTPTEEDGQHSEGCEDRAAAVALPDAVRLELWPSLAQMYRDAAALAAEASTERSAKAERITALEVELVSAHTELEKTKKQRVEERDKVLKLQKAVEMLKKKAAAATTTVAAASPMTPETGSGTGMASSAALASAPPGASTEGTSILSNAPPPQCQMPPSPRNGACEDAEAAKTAKPVLQNDHAPLTASHGTDAGGAAVGVAGDSVEVAAGALESSRSSSAPLQAKIGHPTTPANRTPTLEDLAAAGEEVRGPPGASPSCETFASPQPAQPLQPEAQTQVEPQPATPREQHRIACPTQVLGSAKTQQQQQQQEPRDPAVLQPTRSLFAGISFNADSGASSETPRRSTQAQPLTPALGAADIAGLRVDDPLLDRLLDALTAVPHAATTRSSSENSSSGSCSDENGTAHQGANESLHARLDEEEFGGLRGAAGGAVDTTPRNSGEDDVAGNSGRSLDRLIRRIDKTKERLEQLERAAEAAEKTHPALHAGLLKEIARLHHQLVGDSTSAASAGASNVMSAAMERDLHSIVVASQQQRAAEHAQQQEFLSIIYHQQQQLLAASATPPPQQQQSVNQSPNGRISNSPPSKRRSLSAHNTPTARATSAARSAVLTEHSPPSSRTNGRDHSSFVRHAPATAHADSGWWSPSPSLRQEQQLKKPLIHTAKESMAAFVMRSQSRSP